ncbi:hypothetical protein DVH24_012417 [Malus domestica]|uniref:Uncharacterized protein n=1 Tax=Malus domestica TaxID=3750 RepID=A0A498HV06_MALDO|nr:hypothetical protein DVH24_012417 [Malus domestica]
MQRQPNRQPQESRKSANPPRTDLWDIFNVAEGQFSPVYVGVQHGLKEADKIGSLPGQPQGYVTVDQKAGRAFFHYFVESPQDSSTKPLVLWLNGGPGCSSFGYRAMEELGPFRVNSGRMTLFRNDYAWNNGNYKNYVNFSNFFHRTGTRDLLGVTSDSWVLIFKHNVDKRTAEDSYKFLINWLERFPQYKSRDFFNTNPGISSLLERAMLIGNAWIDDSTGELGIHDYAWTHGMNSDETSAGIHKYCDFSSGNSSSACDKYQSQAREELGNIDIYNIYASLCKTISEATKSLPKSSVDDFDPCSDNYVETYLNLPEVQAALRVIPTEWSACGYIYFWTTLCLNGTLKYALQQGLPGANFITLKIWMDGQPNNHSTHDKAADSKGDKFMDIQVKPFTPEIFHVKYATRSGDTDGRVPVTSSRCPINYTLKLPLQTPWRPWYPNGQVGGYVAAYKGLTFITIRGAGHINRSDHLPSSHLFFRGSFHLPPN